jgi:flagellar basal-body rod protein FlgB
VPNPTDMTVFGLMKARMQMLGERQKIVAENVANVTTPGYTPRDIDQGAFQRSLERAAAQGRSAGAQLTMAATQPGHIATPASGSAAGLPVRRAPDSETTLDGNSVVVEEQMMKIAETRMDFETMVGLYQKSLGLIRLASRSPSQ